MPVNAKMMDSLKKEYGSKKGERVYYAMENKMKKKTKYYGSGPFSKAEEEKGFKIMASASELSKMDDERGLSSPDNRVKPKKGGKKHNG